MPAQLIIIAGPSGSGKSTIVERLLARKKIRLKRLATWTTRAPRPKEKRGRDRRFVSLEAFKREIRKKGFFEWTKIYGIHYGSHRDDVLKALAGRTPVVMDLDPKGVLAMKKRWPATIVIYMDAPRAQVARRLKARKTGQSDVKRRLRDARLFLRIKSLAQATIANPDGRLAETVLAAEKAIRAALAYPDRTPPSKKAQATKP